VRPALQLLALTLLVTFAISAALPAVVVHAQRRQPSKGSKQMNQSVLDFTMNTIDGKAVKLSSYRGKVLLIVNTASECGFTPQYEGLQKLYEMYRDRGLRILAFPANDFGKQEPGTNAMIKNFCSTAFHTTFDLFEKIVVKGRDQHPLYKFITSDSAYAGEVKWNFQKYLVDRSGKISGRYLSAVEPMSAEFRSAVEKLLSARGE
jgi:glutathione peroxidase